MKKILALALALVLALSLTACGGAAKDPTITVPVSPPSQAYIMENAYEYSDKDDYTPEFIHFVP